MTTSEPKLCPDCPFAHFLKDVKPKSYTTTPTDQTTVKTCSKLRALAAKWSWPPCPHFPEIETIAIWGERKCLEQKANSGHE